MIRAVADERLAVRIVSERALRYTEAAAPDEDRPDHVRAASGLVAWNGALVVIQDDASFLALVEGSHVRSIALPRGRNDRRHFEVALGNKLDKLDLEACVAIDAGTSSSELLAFGSGSIAGVRDAIVRIAGERGRETVELVDAQRFYDALRTVTGGVLNVEGAACVRDELWLFHRGNTGPDDRPAILRADLAAVRGFLTGSAIPTIASMPCELGALAGVRFGFTDAATRGDRVIVAFASEASADAIGDGEVGGSCIGVIDGDVIRYAPLVRDARACKVEGLAVLGDTLWITIDSDDPDVPAPLCEVVLIGPW